jgi:hypothetical protein
MASQQQLSDELSSPYSSKGKGESSCRRFEPILQHQQILTVNVRKEPQAADRSVSVVEP